MSQQTDGTGDRVVTDFRDVYAAEYLEIKGHGTSPREPSTDDGMTGLALSGGGIRSAAFCLGVMQVLAERRLLKDVDFLSTVSGGGYTGSFLTARLGAGSAQQDVAGPYGQDPEPIRYLRHHEK